MNRNPAGERQPPEVRNEMASAWTKRGIALLNENTTASLTESLHCFDRAIELRRSPPLRETPWYRYLLAGGWMNRGDALTRLGVPENLAAAVRSYDQALALLQTLDLTSDPRFRKRLALAWMNRGVTLQAQGTALSVRDALGSFDEAIALCRDPAVIDAESRTILVCGLTNRGNALILIQPAAPALARTSVEEALALIAGVEQQELSAAETGLKGRHILCRAIALQIAERSATTVSEDLVAVVTDVVDDAMTLARFWEARGERRLRDLAEELFRFGARAYQIHQPHFVAEFLLENLDPRQTAGGVFPTDQKLHSAASETIASALAAIQREGFRSINTPRFNRFLERIRQLRIAQTRLDELHLADRETIAEAT